MPSATPSLSSSGLLPGQSLGHGRALVATPGPSVIPDRVLAAMAKAMPNMYAGDIVGVTAEILQQLPGLARTTGHPFIVIGNGHAAWEMSIANTMSAGDRVLVLESGRFAVAWGAMAAVSGVEVEVLPGTDRGPVDPAALEERLRADTDHAIHAILTVQTDTATSVRNDIPAIRAAIDAAAHPALLMVDCIASLGCERYEMDAWGVDLTVAACQKGLMVPPGIAFVWAGPKAVAAYDRAGLRTGYFDWEPRMRGEEYYHLFAGTPPISHLYGLHEALTLIREEGGVEAVWRRHEVLAGAVRAAVEAWRTPGGIECNIVEPAYRSNAVTTVRTGSIDAHQLARICEDRAGLTLGAGIGGFGAGAFRIGHMGHLNPPMVLGALGTIEAALCAMGAPITSSGVAAAATHIGSTLASSPTATSTT